MYFFHVLSEDTTESLSLCFTPSFYVLIHNEAEPFLKTKQSQKSNLSLYGRCSSILIVIAALHWTH